MRRATWMTLLSAGLLAASGCDAVRSAKVCGSGAGNGSCYEPSTGTTSGPPTTTATQKDDDLRRQLSGKP